jgi:thiamine pyrophosphate-dependent acetolactate synthase large subunit-like protein
MGIRSAEVSSDEELKIALNEAIAFNGPTVLDVRVDPTAYPLIMNAIRG